MVIKRIKVIEDLDQQQLVKIINEELKHDWKILGDIRSIVTSSIGEHEQIINRITYSVTMTQDD